MSSKWYKRAPPFSWPRAAIGALVGVFMLLVSAEPGAAEQGMLVLYVSDVKDRPIEGVKIATEGDGSTGPPTDVAGKTRIRLAAATRPGTRVTLQIVGASA